MDLLAPSETPAHPDATTVPKQKPKLALVLIQVTGFSSDQSTAVDALNAAVVAQGGDALCVVAEPAPSSTTSQWEQSVRCGRSIWEDAEEVVRRRLIEHKQTSSATH